MVSIFTKIIDGEIPSHRVYEDDSTFAFLDINPRSPGHTLVVPKREVDYLFDLPPADYDALWRAAAAVADGIKQATGCSRVLVVVVGFEVPHAHVHLIPAEGLEDFPFPPPIPQTPEQLAATATAIAARLEIAYDPAVALIVVDVQNDFADPSGSLAVPGGAEIIPLINTEIERAGAAGATIVYTQDWHPPSTPHFAKDGGVWPVHCVEDTWGSELHPHLEVVPDAVFTRKGSGGEDGYSGFTMRNPSEEGEETSTGLEQVLRERGIERVVIAGIATDYCVKETSLDAVRLGFATIVLGAAIRAVDLQPGDGERSVAAMRAAGIELR